MKPYLDEGVLKRVSEANFEPLFSAETHALHTSVIHNELFQGVVQMVEVSLSP